MSELLRIVIKPPRAAEYAENSQNQAGHRMFAGELFVHPIDFSHGSLFTFSLTSAATLAMIFAITSIAAHRDVELVKILVQPNEFSVFMVM